MNSWTYTITTTVSPSGVTPLARQNERNQEGEGKKIMEGVLEELRKRKTPVSNRVLTIDTNIADWKKYVDYARQEPLYNRFELYKLYDQIEFDGHLTSETEKRKNGTLSEEYTFVNINTREQDDELAEEFQTPWFDDIIECALDSAFWGFTAIEAEELSKDNKIISMERVDSKYFSPERKSFLPSPQQVNTTIPLERPLTNWLLTFGKKKDLGLHAKAAKYILYKSFSFSDWARHSERFATPFVWLKTLVTNNEDRKVYEKMLSSFGNNGYAILEDGDELGSLEQKTTKPYEIYQFMLMVCDMELSKLIVGQTSTSNEKAYAGSAEVHERILNAYVLKDMKRIRAEMNTKIIPFLIEKGYKELKGYRFEWQYFIDKKKAKNNSKKNEKPTRPKPSKPTDGNENEELSHQYPIQVNQTIENFYTGCCHH